MTESLEFKALKEFTRLFHHKYSEETLLPNVCELTLYQEKFSKKYGDIGNWKHVRENSDRGHAGLKYNQIGQRSLIPLEILHSEDPFNVISSFVRSLRLGERNYILSQLDEKEESNEIQTIDFNEPTHVNFQEWCNQVQDPDHLFLPLDTKFHDMVFEWRHKNDYDLNMGEIAISGKNIIKIHWVPLDSGFENGYLLSSEGLNIVQKWFGDSPVPEGFTPDSEYDVLSQNRPLMMYIGDEVIQDEDEETPGFKQKVDFLFRIVVSQLMVESNHAVKLKPTRSLSND